MLPTNLLNMVVVAIPCGFAVGQHALAAVNTYTDRGSWEAATGGSIEFFVDFDDVSADTYFLGNPFDAGPFSIVATSIEFNFVDASPFEGGGQWEIDGTTYVLGDVRGAETINMAFDTPISAWCAEFSKIDYGGLDLVLTSDAGITTLQIPNIYGKGFFGFATSPPEAISTMTFSVRDPSKGEAFGMDNVALELYSDCNSNGILDKDDLSGGTSYDCNTNGVPDECDIAADTGEDCNTDGVLDQCQLASTILYENDFEDPGDTLVEWSSSNADDAEAGNFTRFLGRFGNVSGTDEFVILSLPTIIDVSYLLVFDLYIIDSWDGTAPQGGPDRFTISNRRHPGV